MEPNLFKELYLFELNQIDQIFAKIGNLITTLSILGAFIGYLFNIYKFSCTWTSIIFIIFFIITIILYIIAIYNTVTFFYIPKPYSRIPSPLKLNNYYNDLVTYYKDTNEDVEALFKKFINERYMQMAEHNKGINYYRGSRQSKAFKALAFTVIFALLSAIPVLAQNKLYKQSDESNATAQEVKQ